MIGGQLNKQVAADLAITERTIKMHRANIFQKLEVDSMAEMVRLAVPIIITTGNKADAIRERAEQAGCVAFLWKPFSGDAFLALVESIADRPHT